MSTFVLGLIMLFLAVLWLTGVGILFGPLDSHSEIERLNDRKIGGRLAVISGFLFWICTVWTLLASADWPYHDFERSVYIENKTALINAPKWQADLKSSTINLNKKFNRQFEEGEVVKVRVYEPSFMWLESGHTYEINNVYIGGLE